MFVLSTVLFIYLLIDLFIYLIIIIYCGVNCHIVRFFSFGYFESWFEEVEVCAFHCFIVLFLLSLFTVGSIAISYFFLKRSSLYLYNLAE